MAKTTDLPPKAQQPAPTARKVAQSAKVVVSKQVFNDFAAI